MSEFHRQRYWGPGVAACLPFGVLLSTGWTLPVALSGAAILSAAAVGATVVFAAALAAFPVHRRAIRRASAEATIYDLFDISPHPSVVSSFEGDTVRLNPAFASAFGYSPADLGPLTASSVIHPDDRDRVAAVHAELVSGARTSASYTCRVLSKDGTLRAINWHAATIPERRLVFAVARDETTIHDAPEELPALDIARRAAAAEGIRAAEERARVETTADDVLRGEEQLRIFVENTPTAVAMLDRDMRYLVASRRWSEDHGLGSESLVGRRHYDVFPDVSQRWRDIHERCLQGATETCEEDPFLLPDGSREWVRWEVHPWRDADGEVGGIIILIEMITARRRDAQELRESAANLVRINSELEAFTYSVSHDLKEPLRTLEAFSQFLLNDYADKLDAEGQDLLNRLALASARMKHLIEDLLTISRIGSEPEAASAVTVKQVIAEIVENMRVTVLERNASVHVDDLPEVFTDSRRVHQIFANLISNGIKFNTSEAPRVDIGWREDDAGETVFVVRDNGIGIDPAYHDKIFGVFQRLHRREEFEGTGAGLAIAKRAVEALGGAIRVESKLEHGTTFFVTLPGSQQQQTLDEQAAQRRENCGSGHGKQQPS